eukprot:TRINITY_DN1283_c0_g2_i10.p1 TRINITY_DN1283_c0_g2~~TRINITY_DN1283_c0_g2_i10.p1  ORF type:complete len:406 (+),score=137.95 TRINITY_DN1283_c0_g2_i10:827-2044(+)
MLNLRGFDIDFNPYFMSYLVVLLEGERVEFRLYADEEKFKDKKVQDHIQKVGVKLFPYEKIMEDLAALDKQTAGIELNSVNFKILSLVRSKDNKVVDLLDVIPKLKQKKNAVELEGFRKCHVRDGVGLIKHIAWLEHQLNALNRTDIDEYMASENVHEFRKAQDKFMGLSFKTIASTGPNASVVHYKPTKETALKVTNKEIYLVDSGAHYLDGTTDVTRTVHFTTPTEYQREMYTRVLRGNLSLERAVFPNKEQITGAMLDMYTRKYLWEVGKDYGHGTGHGVGHFLGVHEGPIGVGILRTTPFEEGHVTSNEPGFYEDNQFGIRIENLIMCVKAKCEGFLCFENVTVVPYCNALIKWEMLNKEEIDQINSYHKKVHDTLKPLLAGDEITLKYLEKECKPHEAKP